MWVWLKWIWNLNLPLLLYEVIAMAITGQMIVHNIYPGLYQTSKFSESDFDTLLKLNIGAIIDLEGGVDLLPAFVGQENYKYWPIVDEPKLPNLKQLDEVAQWGFNKWKEGKVVLVHCRQGKNRSGLVMGKILILKGLNGKEAVALIQSKVPGGLSNIVFKEYLEGL